jgi:hypothetical protein
MPDPIPNQPTTNQPPPLQPAAAPPVQPTPTAVPKTSGQVIKDAGDQFAQGYADLASFMGGEEPAMGQQAQPPTGDQPPAEPQATEQPKPEGDDVDKLLRQTLGEEFGESAVNRIDFYRLNDPTYMGELEQRDPKLASATMRVIMNTRNLIDNTVAKARQKDTYLRQHARQPTQPTQPVQPTQAAQPTQDPRAATTQAILGRLQQEAASIREEMKRLSDEPPPSAPQPTGEGKPAAANDGLFRMGGDLEGQEGSTGVTTEQIMAHLDARQQRAERKQELHLRMLQLQNAIRDQRDNLKDMEAKRSLQTVAQDFSERDRQTQQQRFVQQRRGYLVGKEQELAGTLEKVQERLNQTYNIPTEHARLLAKAAMSDLNNGQWNRENVRRAVWGARSQADINGIIRGYQDAVIRSYSDQIKPFLRDGTYWRAGSANPAQVQPMQSQAPVAPTHNVYQAPPRNAYQPPGAPPADMAAQQTNAPRKTYKDVFNPNTVRGFAEEYAQAESFIKNLNSMPTNVSTAMRQQMR